MFTDLRIAFGSYRLVFRNMGCFPVLLVSVKHCDYIKVNVELVHTNQLLQKFQLKLRNWNLFWLLLRCDHHIRISQLTTVFLNHGSVDICDWVVLCCEGLSFLL